MKCNKPASFVVHWPGKNSPMCNEHYKAARKVGEAIGLPLVSATPIMPDQETCNAEVELSETLEGDN